MLDLWNVPFDGDTTNGGRDARQLEL
jgi:hypothetical protein